MDINLFSRLSVINLDNMELPVENVTHKMSESRHNEPVASPSLVAIVKFVSNGSSKRRKKGMSSGYVRLSGYHQPPTSGGRRDLA